MYRVLTKPLSSNSVRIVSSDDSMNEWFYFRVVNNCLKTSLVLHTRQLKEDNGKTNKTLSTIRSPWRQSGWSPVGSPVGEERIYDGKDLFNSPFLRDCLCTVWYDVMMFKVLHKAYRESAQSLYTTSRIGILRFFKIKKRVFVCVKNIENVIKSIKSLERYLHCALWNKCIYIQHYIKLLIKVWP